MKQLTLKRTKKHPHVFHSFTDGGAGKKEKSILFANTSYQIYVLVHRPSPPLLCTEIAPL